MEKNADTLANIIAGIAHEINNPLAIIVEEAGWMKELLLEEDFDKNPNYEEFKRSLNQILTQAGRCRDVTHGLFSFSQKGGRKPQSFQLNELIETVVKDSERTALAAKIAINMDLTPNLPSIYAVPSEISGVLTNIINNGIHAQQNKGGQITVKSSIKEDQILIDIIDQGQGQGILPENLERIFEPFFTTKEKGKGTGLGLWICKNIIENMSGNIFVQSKVGIGTTFHIQIPLKAAPRLLTLEKKSSEEIPTTEQGMLSPLNPRVLLVDDEVSFVEILCKRLRRRNMTVYTAFSGEDALKEINETHNIDVVVIDVNMPDMDGISTLREIKNKKPQIEVILLSGNNTADTAIEGLKLGAFDYMLKPYDINQLVDSIQKATAHKTKHERELLEAKVRHLALSRP